ncbi:MAG: isoprenyl transferase [Lachnospiraceae bacterium]|nr:isoprenyl transferase [Lachnospiraceae bacterium]
MKIPKHVAIILDGNGRWAKAQGMPRSYGHIQGAANVENICRAAHDMGIEYLTVYAFSTENWSRPSDEVAQLMDLLEKYLKNCLKTAKKNNMVIKVIGDITGLNDSLRSRITELEKATADYSGLHFTIALNYGSHDEILRAFNRILADMEKGTIEKQEITKELFESYLDTAGMPMPDLMIRTSGEMRLSNFLLWQLAYSEFYFTPVPWPAFDRAELEKAVEEYSLRDRRYGGV